MPSRLLLAFALIAVCLWPAIGRAWCEDAELAPVAREHARGVDSEGLLARLREAGNQAPSVYATRVVPEAIQAFVEGLEARGVAPFRCGRHETSDGFVHLVAVPSQGHIEVAGTRVRVRLEAPFRDPVLYVAHSSGVIERIAVEVGEEVDIDAAGETMLQLVATDPAHGPRVVAERGERTESPSATVDAERRAVGAMPLRPNRLLSRAARAHAERVCAAGRVAHVLEGRGPEERLRSVGVTARAVGEVVARGGDLARAWRALLRSPSHAFALRQRAFTDWGHASVQREDGTCLVVMLAAWPRFRPTALRE